MRQQPVGLRMTNPPLTPSRPSSPSDPTRLCACTSPNLVADAERADAVPHLGINLASEPN